MLKKAKIVVTGMVQGVGYRYWAYEQMRELGLLGKAENQGDGNVLIEVEGSQESIDELARLCREGPPMADVVDVKVQWEGKS